MWQDAHQEHHRLAMMPDEQRKLALAKRDKAAPPCADCGNESAFMARWDDGRTEFACTMHWERQPYGYWLARVETFVDDAAVAAVRGH